ncbi:hypothetical protein Tco_0957323 [Tanacetum coccineum]
MSLTLWNDELQAVVDMSTYQLCDKYGKSEHKDMFHTEITTLVGKKYAFKVSIYAYNVKKMLPVFTVLRLFDDHEIIDPYPPSATLTKIPRGRQNSAVMYVTPLDLESKTDENTTPVNTVKSIATTSGTNDAKKKRPAEDDYGSESSNGKKAKMVEVKIEKDA